MKFLYPILIALILTSCESIEFLEGEYEPACKGTRRSEWDNCIGTAIFPGGTKYVGEIKDGWFRGKITITNLEGYKYTGEFYRNNLNGQGTKTYPNGNKYVGKFLDGKFSGQGTYTFANGERGSNHCQ